MAGLAALLLELAPELQSGEPSDNPTADRAALRDAILSGAVDLGPAGVDNTYGYGRVNGTASSNAVVPVGPPGPPTGVTAVAGDGQVNVSWTAPASDGGSAITQYTITSDPGGVTAVENGVTLTSTVLGLANSTTYTFTVTASNVAWTSSPSTPSNSVTPALPPTPTPIPGLTTWGMWLFAGLMGYVVLWRIRRSDRMPQRKKSTNA